MSVSPVHDNLEDLFICIIEDNLFGFALLELAVKSHLEHGGLAADDVIVDVVNRLAETDLKGHDLLAASS